MEATVTRERILNCERTASSVCWPRRGLLLFLLLLGANTASQAQTSECHTDRRTCVTACINAQETPSPLPRLRILMFGEREHERALLLPETVRPGRARCVYQETRRQTLRTTLSGVRQAGMLTCFRSKKHRMLPHLEKLPSRAPGML